MQPAETISINLICPQVFMGPIQIKVNSMNITYLISFTILYNHLIFDLWFNIFALHMEKSASYFLHSQAPIQDLRLKIIIFFVYYTS